MRVTRESGRNREYVASNASIRVWMEPMRLADSSPGVVIRHGAPIASKLRARAVTSYLVTKGIAEARLSSKGWGDSQPVANNATPEGRAQNRRTELKVISR